MKSPRLYHVVDPATGRVYCQDAATGAPVGLATLGPGLRPAALRNPIARATVQLLARRFKVLGLVVRPAADGVVSALPK